MSRISRRPVSPTERGRWLQRLERGEGISRIASTTNRDVRVIKRHIAIAREERDLSGARRDFMRGRMEHHQDDLLAEASRLRKLVSAGSANGLVPTDPVMSKVHEGLLQHCWRHPVGRLFRRYFDLAQRFRDERDALEKELIGMISQAEDVPADSLTDILANIVVLKTMDSLESGAALAREYDADSERQGHVDWVGSRLTARTLEPEMRSKVKALHGRLVDKADGAMIGLRSQMSELRQVGAEVADELDGLLARHMVPARCKYCPM